VLVCGAADAIAQEWEALLFDDAVFDDMCSFVGAESSVDILDNEEKGSFARLYFLLHMNHAATYARRVKRPMSRLLLFSYCWHFVSLVALCAVVSVWARRVWRTPGELSLCQ
jgi:hypothetical protein